MWRSLGIRECVEESATSMVVCPWQMLHICQAEEIACQDFNAMIASSRK
jgi:hypothetical protein